MSLMSDIGAAIKSKLDLKANLASPTFTGTVTAPTLLLGGIGYGNQLKGGTGDGASFDTYNMTIRSWWGIGFRDYTDSTTVKAYIDCRNGNIGTSGSFIGNLNGNAATATTAGNGGVTSVNGLTGAVTIAAGLANYIAGSYVETEYFKSGSTISGTPTKVASVYMARPGTVTVSFQIYDVTNNDNSVYGRIYKNGIAVGTSRATSNGSATSFTENIAVVAGDILQLYVWGALSVGYNGLKITVANPTKSSY